MTDLEQYYNKFNEEKRLNSRHGQMEYRVSMKYINQFLELRKQEMGISDNSQLKFLDIGAGTGRYSVPIAEQGYDVTALELVKYNLGILKQKGSNVKAYQGNALKLKRFDDNSFDFTLLFGPMYHLLSKDEQIQAMKEANRVTKPGGYIFVAYVMNEYAFLTYGIVEGHILESQEKGTLNHDFHVIPGDEDLYHFMRLEDIDSINEACGMKRVKIFSPDGPANHMRREVNALSPEQFEQFVAYQMTTAERMDLIGAAAHTVDILQA